MSLDESIRSTITPELTSNTPQLIAQRAKPAPHITAREWKIHLSLFALTVITAILAGTMLVVPELDVPEPPLRTAIDYVLYVPLGYLNSVAVLLQQALEHPALLLQGAVFAGSLLSILFAHEMGHYLACRHYGVDATLPYFIPAPPLFLAGTFGAFIKMKSPIPSRRALFDIGLAGPLAGFVALLPVAVVGVLRLESASIPA